MEFRDGGQKTLTKKKRNETKRYKTWQTQLQSTQSVNRSLSSVCMEKSFFHCNFVSISVWCFNKMWLLFYSAAFNTHIEYPRRMYMCLLFPCVSHFTHLSNKKRERERQFMYSCVFPNATWWLYASISFLLGVKAQRHKIAVMLLHVREQETILIDTEKQVSDMSIQSISHLVTFPLSFTLSQRFFRFITLPRPFSMLNIHIYSLERIRRGSQKMYIQPKTYKLCDFGWFVCAIWTIIS